MDWFQIGKGVCHCHPAYLTYMQSTSCEMWNWIKHKLQSSAGRNINNLRYADDTTLMAESEEELKSLLMKVKEESEKVGGQRGLACCSAWGHKESDTTEQLN